MNGFKNKLAAGLMFGAFIIFPFANFYNSSITTKLRDLQNQLWSYIMAGGKQEAEKKQESFNVPNTAEKELNITPSCAKTYE